PARGEPLDVLRETVRAEVPRVEVGLLAVEAALDAELALLEPVPEGLGLRRGGRERRFVVGSLAIVGHRALLRAASAGSRSRTGLGAGPEVLARATAAPGTRESWSIVGARTIPQAHEMKSPGRFHPEPFFGQRRDRLLRDQARARRAAAVRLLAARDFT